LGLVADRCPYAPNLVREFRPTSGDVIKEHLENQTRYGIEVARERLATDTKGLKRYGSASRKRVNHQRWLIRAAVGTIVRGLHQGATHVQINRLRRVIPVGEIGDELQ
jgi:hypothetical protein